MDISYSKSARPNNSIDIIRFTYLAGSATVCYDASEDRQRLPRRRGSMRGRIVPCGERRPVAVESRPATQRADAGDCRRDGVGNIMPASALQWLHPGLRFGQQTLLRLGIILYGVRLTVHDLANLGVRALILDLIVIEMF